MSSIPSTLPGIAVSFVGLLLGQLFNPKSANQPFRPAGFVMLRKGAMLLLLVAHLLHHGSAHPGKGGG
ncbi:hypothetical protein BH10PSE14_BH10PSE14_24550 [soil metagenome]